MKGLFADTFRGLTVLLTGHTGFKGSWLAIWLKEMGAKVVGYSLTEPPTLPSNFEVSGVGERIIDIRGDICSYESLRQTIHEYNPELVIHLAAQTTVLPSYEQPKPYFDTNVGGTINVLEATRTTNSIKALIVCTSDKVYENNEWVWGYRENDRLGGYDAYSTSKAMADLASTSYRRSFFSNGNDSAKRGVAVGTVRAGNVIGGGDFTEYGLIADSMRALLSGVPISLRNPDSIRPWQFVLEPLSGYLWLAVNLLRQDGHQFAEAWNFGPLQNAGVTAHAVAEQVIALWGGGSWTTVQSGSDRSEPPRPHETKYLHLNWDKAAARLNWRPVFTIEEALAETVKWYKAYGNNQVMYNVCCECIESYVKRAAEVQVEWTRSV